MESIKSFFRQEAVKKVCALIFLLLLLISVKKELNLLLFTFIFGFVFYSVQNKIYRFLRRWVRIHSNWITIGLYLIFVLGIGISIARYVPVLTKQLMGIGGKISDFDITSLTSAINPQIMSVIQQSGVTQSLKSGGHGLMLIVTHVGDVSLQIFMALLLSFFFLLERDSLMRFGKKLEQSKLAYLYGTYQNYGRNFLNSFGEMIQVQIATAIINSVLSAGMLWLLGFSDVIGWGFMIFTLGLIPVAGVLISFVPLSIVALMDGGVSRLLEVVAMIIILHVLETYVMSPKMMSVNTKLPIFITFVTLIFAEHFLGLWGLLVGIPLLLFFLDLAGVHSPSKTDFRRDEGGI